MSKPINRREFLRMSAALAAGATLSPGDSALARTIATASNATPTLPHRVLGRTGVTVSILGLGGGGILSESTNPDILLPLLNEALDAGVTYFDTAFNYGKDGQCENNLGLVMGTPRRNKVFLATKCEDRTYDGARKQVETSLKRLRVGYLDLIQVHQVDDKDDVRALGAKNGVLSALRKLQDQKLVRFIGLTGHPNSPRVKQALEAYDWDTLLCWINPALPCRPVFDDQLPIAQKKNMGVIAMKTFGGSPGRLIGSGVGKADAPTLLRFAWSQPVATAVPAVTGLDQLRQNVALARRFQPLTHKEQKSLAAHINASPTEAGAPFHHDGLA